MYTIENTQLKITINEKGAELHSVIAKDGQHEFLWNGDPAFWAKRSPVLFPVIGSLKNNTYFFEDHSYELGRHGFARDKTFKVTAQSGTSLSLMLESDEDTLKLFPFHFNFSLIYTLQEKTLCVTYQVNNTGSKKMYFSVGGHPAFKLPIADGLKYEDYYLLFNKIENSGRWPISKDGLIEATPTPLLENTNKLPLSKELFYKDAIVLKGLQSNEVQLKSDKAPLGFSFSFDGFPFLGIWAAKDADFVCIEPWCGIADSVNTNQDIKDKEGINVLEAGETFKRTWSIALFSS